MNTEQQKKELAARMILSETDSRERTALVEWLDSLLRIRNSPLSKKEKIKQALRTTADHKIIFPVIKNLLRQIRKHAWDRRNSSSRLAILGAAIGATVFGGQSAGIAALGGAIGVPLWIVLGAGGSFAGLLLEEARKKGTDYIDVEYTVVKDRNKSED